MKCIDELKKIGIDKVSAKTRITQDKIQDIIDFKFDAFNKTRALGFTQIITRDFGVDLSEWLAAYNDYHSSTEQVEATENNSVDEISKNINIPIESDKKDKSYIALIVVLIVLVALFMGFFVYNNFISSSDSPNSPKSANQSTLTPLQQIQKQNQMDLANNADSTPNVADSSDSNQNAQNPQVDSQADLQVDSTKAQENTTADSQQKSVNVADSSATTNQTRISSQVDELIITPNEPLWVGIIDLKTHRKKQLSIDSQQSFLLDGDKLIRTGHSYFSLSSGTNFAKQYIGGDNKYFLYRVEGGLREIGKAEFLELNKGEEW